MKSILISMLFLSLSQSAFANEELALIMKDLGENFKTIAVELQSGQLTLTSLDAAEQLHSNLVAANLLLPDSATTDELKMQYSEIMAKTIVKAIELQDAMKVVLSDESQNVSPVLQIFSEINELRKEGHHFFKAE